MNLIKIQRFGKSVSQQQQHGSYWSSGVDLKVPCNVIGLTLISLSIALTLIGLGAKAKYKDFGRRRSKEYRDFVRDAQTYRKFDLDKDDDRDDLTAFNKRTLLATKSRQFERGKVYQLKPLRKRIITPSASSSDETEWESTEDEFECPRKNLTLIRCCCQLDKYPFSFKSDQYLERSCRRTLSKLKAKSQALSEFSQKKNQERKFSEDESPYTDSFSKYRNLMPKEIKKSPNLSEFLHHNETKAQKRANSWSSHMHINTLSIK